MPYLQNCSHKHTYYNMNAADNLSANPERSGYGKQKCLCWRFKEIYVAYFGPV